MLLTQAVSLFFGNFPGRIHSGRRCAGQDCNRFLGFEPPVWVTCSSRNNQVGPVHAEQLPSWTVAVSTSWWGKVIGKVILNDPKKLLTTQVSSDLLKAARKDMDEAEDRIESLKAGSVESFWILSELPGALFLAGVARPCRCRLPNLFREMSGRNMHVAIK